MPNSVVVREFSRYTSSHGVVDAQGAKELVASAKEMNASSRGCCGLGKSKKGDKELASLASANSDRFDAAGLATVKYYLKNHSMPSGAALSSTTTNPARPNGASTVTPSPADANSPFGKVILNWKADKSTWPCHWWPMQEAGGPGGDPFNNLYAAGGPLEKYDAAFKRNSRAIELGNNAKPFGSGPDFAWFGHCNFASQAACLLREPVKDVTLNGVTFTARDISGLLVKVVPSLSTGEDFVGNRDNGPADDPNEPYPSTFLDEVLLKWGGKEGRPLPFILDIDPKPQVWNYPFDQGKVFESDKAPPGFAGSVPSGGKVKFYRAELKGTGFDDEARNYQFWIQYDSTGKAMSSAWIQAQDGDDKPNPDFCWRPKQERDLNNKAFWVTNPEVQNNSAVLAEDVYTLYKMSIA